MCNMFSMKFNGTYYGVVYPDPIDMLIEQAELFYTMASNILPTFAQSKVELRARSSDGEVISYIDGEMTQRNAGSNKTISRSRTLIIKFLKLVAQHFRTTREVSFYAEELCITTTYLYKLTHRRWNLSPKELIDQQTICEIKTLLSSTDMSVKEIASSLHFEDTPYMCHYFRQRTGLSPLEYCSGGRRL